MKAWLAEHAHDMLLVFAGMYVLVGAAAAFGIALWVLWRVLRGLA